MRTETLLNDFANRSFRDTADQDYISARMSYRAGLMEQFHWQGLQALEKYLKAILLYNRIPATDVRHDLSRALNYAKKLPFKLDLSESSDDLIAHLDKFGRFRYLEASYYIRGPKLLQLDKTVWEIRRFCRVINYETTLKDGTTKAMLPFELEKIERSKNAPPHKFRIFGGNLEKILDKRDHPARAPLIWQNAFFGSTTRKTVRMAIPFEAKNSPLALHPEILGEVRKYVYLSKEVVRAYSEQR